MSPSPKDARYSLLYTLHSCIECLKTHSIVICRGKKDLEISEWCLCAVAYFAKQATAYGQQGTILCHDLYLMANERHICIAALIIPGEILLAFGNNRTTELFKRITRLPFPPVWILHGLIAEPVPFPTHQANPHANPHPLLRDIAQ